MEVIKVGDDKIEKIVITLNPVEIGVLYAAVNMRRDDRLNPATMSVLEKFVENVITNAELKPLFMCSK